MRLHKFGGVLLLLVACICKVEAQSSHIDVTTTASSWAYTLFNDETAGSSNYLGYYKLTVDAPVIVTGTPAGWDFQTDNSSYILWFNTDIALPYPHDIAPGNSLNGFEIQSTVATSKPLSYDLSFWDHAADAPGPVSSGLTLSPFALAVPEPGAWTLLASGALGVGWMARHRRR